MSTYIAINRDDYIRETSSSGGVFYELSRYIIADGGVVFGAKFDEEWNVIHSHSDALEGITLFQGSKYVQSDMQGEYTIARSYLEQGRKVLFSGTPCQMAGLKAYLGKEYENLITVDFVCHGVPSKDVWQQYLSEKSDGKQINRISFRDKTEGWKNFSLKIDFVNGSAYRQSQQKEDYIIGFVKDIFLRPSCYECKFKDLNRMSDFTMADFWGIQEEYPAMDDDKGASVLMVNSPKGDAVWKKIKENFIYDEIDIGRVVKHNPNAVRSAKRTPDREKFFRKHNYSVKRIRQYTTLTMKQKFLRKIRKIIARLFKY